jgi:hypothetical protein
MISYNVDNILKSYCYNIVIILLSCSYIVHMFARPLKPRAQAIGGATRPAEENLPNKLPRGKRAVSQNMTIWGVNHGKSSIFRHQINMASFDLSYNWPLLAIISQLYAHQTIIPIIFCCPARFKMLPGKLQRHCEDHPRHKIRRGRIDLLWFTGWWFLIIMDVNGGKL